MKITSYYKLHLFYHRYAYFITINNFTDYLSILNMSVHYIHSFCLQYTYYWKCNNKLTANR